MQKLRTQYIQSEFGNIPKDWRIVNLEDLSFRIMKGIFDLNPVNYVKEGIPFLRISDIKNNTFEIATTKFISEGLNKKFPSSQLYPGDLVISKVGSVWLSDKIAKIPNSISCCNISQNLIGIKLDNQKLYSDYLLFLLQLPSYMSRVTSGSNTTTLKSIQLEVLRKLPIILPPIKEQQKITSILKKVDELIQKTDQIIGQTQKLKKGLMQRLLTKGIGHNKFKKTSVGEILEDWITENIGTYVNILSGEYFPYNEFSNEGIPVLKIDNVMYGNVDWTNKTYLPKNYLASHKHLVLNEDDIVLALNRPITNNKVKVAIVRRKDTPSILYQRVGKLEFSQNQNLDRKIFLHLFNKSIF